MLALLDMQALPKKLLPLILFGIAATSLFSARPAQAYTVTLAQVGSDVVETGSGAVNLTGLTLDTTGLGLFAIMRPDLALLSSGQGGGVPIDFYMGFTGPASFGSGGQTNASTGSGDFVGIFVGIFGDLVLPQGYVSGAALSSSATWNNATLASLGVTPGTYEWTWGTDLPNQNFTLIVEAPVGAPDGGTTVSLLGCALLGLLGLRRRLAC